MNFARSTLALAASVFVACTPPPADTGDANTATDAVDATHAVDAGDAGDPADAFDAGDTTDGSHTADAGRDTYGEDCTIIGCTTWYNLRFIVHDASGMPVIGYTVRVTNGDGHSWSVTCAAGTTADGGAACDGSVDLVEHAGTSVTDPDEAATLQIVTDAGAMWSGSLASIQAPTHPNGASCPPVCYASPITFTLPSS